MVRKRRNNSDSLFEFCVEQLEVRRLLAGNVLVDVKGDDLTIRGDSADNELELHVLGGTIWVAGVNGTALTGDAAGSGGNFDTGLAARGEGGLDKFKVILKSGNDRLTIMDSLHINGRSTVSLSGGDDQFLIDGANGRSGSNFTIRGASGNDLVQLDGWSFDGKTNISLSGGDDTLGIGVSNTRFVDPKSKLIGGGGVDELAPLAGDSDFGRIPVGVDLVVSADDVLKEFAPGTVEIESLGVVSKSFENVAANANLTAADITFNAATIDGSPVGSLAAVGFGYAAGAGTAGVLTFATAGASAFAGLGAGDTTLVEVAFTFTVNGQAEAGVMSYTVSGDSQDYDASIELLGPAVVGQEAEVSVATGTGVGVLEVDVLGTADLSQTVAAVDLLMPTAAATGLADNLMLTVAGAYASDDSDAMATASSGSVAMAGAGDTSSATAIASGGSIATAFAFDGSTAVASASDQSSSQAAAAEDSVASAITTRSSSATAVAFEVSASSALADEVSDAASLAEDGSAAEATAVTDSSATATAEQTSNATATAQVSSSAVANADETSSATAFSQDEAVASADGANASIANAVALTGSAASASSDLSSDALAFAENGSAADATATTTSSANASAEDGADATAKSQGFTVPMNTPTVIPVIVSADDAAGPVETVVFSGLPVGTILSAGTSNGDGTEWTFTGAPPAGLTFTPPAGFVGSFELIATASDGTAMVSTSQMIEVS